MKSRTNRKWAQHTGAHFFKILDIMIVAVLILSALLFILYPVLCIIKQSVLADNDFSLSAYADLFGKNLRLLKNSVFVAVLTALLATFLSVCVATCVCFAGKRVKSGLSALLLISMVSPPFISSLAYIQLFGRRGSITHGLLGLSVDPYGWVGVVLMQTIFFTSLNALLLIGILDRVDINLVRSSKDLGAGNLHTYRYIILPLIRPAVIICFLLSFIRSMADYGTPVVIGGRYENLATEIYMQLIGFANLQKSAAMNVLLLLPAVIVFCLYRYLLGKSNRWLNPNENTESGLDKVYAPGGLTGIGLKLLSFLFFTIMMLQYGSILVNSFSKQLGGVHYFSLEPFQNLLERNKDTFIRSILYALIVALAGTVIGLLISYYVERRKLRFGGMLDFLVTMPYMIPGSCFGIGYILAFNHAPLKLTGTAAIVVLNMIFKQLAITTKTASASLLQIPVELDMAAGDLGAHKLRVLKDILVPNLKHVFAAGFVYNFTTAMVTAGAVIFLVSPGQKIAVFTLFDVINSGKYAEASMISTLLIACTVLVNLLFIKTLKKERKVPECI